MEREEILQTEIRRLRSVVREVQQQRDSLMTATKRLFNLMTESEMYTHRDAIDALHSAIKLIELS